MFKSIRNNYDYVKHTQNHINAFKEIEDKLPDIEDIYNRDIYIKYLKICFKSIYCFTSFFSDEKFFKTPEISQTVINNINSKLTDINKFINGHKRALDVIDTNINETHFKTLSDDIISFKESIDQEVIYYKAYNDFRKEHYLDSVSDTRSKISEFFDIFRSTKRKITRMSEDDFQDEKNPFNDDYIKEITEFFKNIFVNIEKYEKLTTNYFKALNDVEHFQSILFPSLKENFKNFEYYY
ncbi:hypothetical protein NBO_36g0007 [Nosema bombycis CQ1]|uniref:Uncharacterized protein n=1 Tax=Nosema bombycis (strain CQ1 / CVCC 102059) TaxID=578461 RepID=R0KTK2_NOSB1|nr:hypothetical protein NBO_36g0007 [Nosema bombycis CQ1]|eukprot:EOB14146.1 hypothetical protein NBO_36g0007 [Nosema bombycis CQ1]